MQMEQESRIYFKKYFQNAIWLKLRYSSPFVMYPVQRRVKSWELNKDSPRAYGQLQYSVELSGRINLYSIMAFLMQNLNGLFFTAKWSQLIIYQFGRYVTQVTFLFQTRNIMAPFGAIILQSTFKLACSCSSYMFQRALFTVIKCVETLQLKLFQNILTHQVYLHCMCFWNESWQYLNIE
ncbi:Hypothetical_protein [Hexamita inflata]|uniref:Hypothetical_protein n=1 Tax=Hexamita inflata TaxID=28002 RepID=A0ABP1GI74_9EUKA